MKKTIKGVTAVLLSVIMVFSFFGCKKEVEEPTTTTEPTTVEQTTAPKKVGLRTDNPFTGDTNYNPQAVGIRPVAVVVENLSPARPQWGIETPDIIVEGEVEGGISRMLWMYADYTKLPEKLGPIRSARPSYVEFAELFDSIFIHWGGSHNKGDYIGGYGIFGRDNLAHLDGMKGGKLFGRDHTRLVSSEHRGVLYGDRVAEAIDEAGYRKKINYNKYKGFRFYQQVKNVGTDKAGTINVTFSSRTDTRAFEYNTEDKKYHTNDWETDVSFQNVIVLMADSTYITTPYKGSKTTYLNYDIYGFKGTGYLASNNTITKINWSTENKELNLTDENGKQIKLNKGNSYIGLASANHEGKVSFS